MGRLISLFKNPVILIWVVVFVILIPVLKPGFFSFHDETHIVDVYQMIRSLEVSGFPPRFAPDFNFNLGHPYFNFYYHLPFYITTVFYFLTSSMTDAYKYMLGLSVILAASGFYLFLRNHVSKTPAVFGALVYVLSPYFAVDLYVRGAPGEMYILALFPWAAYLLFNYLKKPNPVSLALASIPIFLIALSHNVLLPFIYSLIFLYGVVNLFLQKNNLKSSLKIIWPFLTGVLLAAYYLLPALMEVEFISTYEQINIADHFPFIKQLIIPHWGYGPSIWGFLDDVSFDIGTVNLLSLAVSLGLFKFAKREHKILLIFFWIMFGAAVILMNSRTLFFWESVRFLRLVQFPWRMLLLTTISTAFIAGVAIEIFSEKFKTKTKWLLAGVFISLIGLNIWHYQPSEYKQISDERYLQLYFANQSFKNTYPAEVPFSEEYRNFTEDFIPPTIWQSKRPSNLLPAVGFADPASLNYPSSINFLSKGLSYEINYVADKESKIIVSKAYFPGWEATQNDQKLPVEPYSEFGIIAVTVPSGVGTVNLKFNNTPVRTAANLVSAITLLGILVSLVYPSFRKKFK